MRQSDPPQYPFELLEASREGRDEKQGATSSSLQVSFTFDQSNTHLYRSNKVENPADNNLNKLASFSLTQSFEEDVQGEKIASF